MNLISWRFTLGLLVGFWSLNSFAVVPPDDDIARYEQISIQTAEGWILDAHLAIPRSATGPVPAVLMLSGSGAMNRYGELPANATQSGKPELLYRSFEQAFLKAGVAVLMYDKRGVRAINNTFMVSQKDPQVLATADAVRLAQDALRAFEVMSRHPAVNSRRMALFGHSEGGLLALKIAEQRPQQVTTIFNFSVQSRGMSEILRYQYVERNMRLFAIADANFDGALDLNEMRGFADRTSISFFDIFRMADIDRDGRLSEGEWRFYWTNELSILMRQVRDDTVPWTAQIPRLWFRQYILEGGYLDRQAVFCDRTVIFHGELDDQTPYEDAVSLKTLCDLRRQPLRMYTYGALGHGFSPRRGFRFWQNTLAPIDARVTQDLTREVSARLAR